MRLRIGSYNIANGHYIGHDFSVIAGDIVDMKLDIVGLQEVDRFAARSKYHDTLSELSALTGLPHYAYAKAISLSGYGNAGEYGIAILSKYPILTAERFCLPSGNSEQRVLLHIKLDIDGRIIDVFNTHLSFGRADLRREQMQVIEEKIFSDGYCLLTGDFNVDDLSDFAGLPSLTPVLSEAHKYITFPDGEITIDNILYSDAFSLVSDSALHVKHSDHFPIYAEFEMK